MSICIPTLNRGRFIGETLDNILPQLTDDVEVVIVDGGSTDDTQEVVALRASRCPDLRYIRRDATGGAPSNEGFDRDCDFAVEQARGVYCWLFTDDDLFAPGAVARILQELRTATPDLLIVDAEVRDVYLTEVFESRRLPFEGVRDYDLGDADSFMADVGNSLTFVGVVIVRRAVWLARDRRSFYGSGFIHVGVLLQSPMHAIRVVGEPLVLIRMGNAAWSKRAFDIWMVQWPRLIWSFGGYSDEAKARVAAREPWRERAQLLQYRAYGSFTRGKLADLPLARLPMPRRLQLKLISWIPQKVAHVAMMAYLVARDRRATSLSYNLLVASPNSNSISRALGRRVGLNPRRST